jgi:imidazolonepropionase-like amidohydrolase
MKSRFRIAILVLLVLVFPAFHAAAAVTAIESVTIIDGISDSPLTDAIMVIEGNTIRSIGKRGSVPIPAGATVINLAGKTIIPGLISLHGHIGRTEGLELNEEYFNRARIERDAKAYLYYGVTGLLSLGHDREAMAGFRADQRADKVVGARLYTAGLGFGAKGGWPNNPYVHRPTNPEEARAMARQELAKHPDVIKIWVDDRLKTAPQFPPEIYGPIIEEARKQHVKVAAHIFYLEDAKELMRRGVSALAHSVQDREVDDEFLALAKKTGVVQITTLAGIGKNADYVADPSFLKDPGLRLLFPAKALQTLSSPDYRRKLADSPDLPKIQAWEATAAKNAKKIADAGIPIALGTDSGLPGNFPGLWEHRELELLVRAGLTPMQAIHAGTINSARFLGVEKQYGSLTSGKVADFIVLDADPLVSIGNTRRISAVWMNGTAVNREALGIEQ